jgi:type I restriction enzyme M protein
LLRKFAEGSGQSAGEFYTPREVAVVMANILDPKANEEICDPCCGSGGLLIKCHLRFKEKFGEETSAPLRFYGQEILHSTYAMALMNAFIHDMEADIRLGDTMNRPAFLQNGKSLKKFDVVTANPMWNQNFTQETYEKDPYHRFSWGYSPSNTADWGWVQHMYSSLRDKGRMAVVLDTGVVSRGSGNASTNRERDIRKAFVEQDWVEAVILLPANLFYNTTAPGVILLINKAKQHPKEILLINASQLFKKGRPKNYLDEESIKQISEIYAQWQDVKGISKVITTQDALQNDANLSPSRYVASGEEEEVMLLEDAIVMVREAEEERQKAEKKLS